MNALDPVFPSPAPRAPVIAILGATGAVGVELVRSLETRQFPVAELRLLASERSAGRSVGFRGREIVVETVSERAFAGVDIAFFSAGADLSRVWAPVALDTGAFVIDNSSAFRMDPSVPLVVPEVNAAALAGGARLIANPNCVAAIATVALAPLLRTWSITRLTMVTYQSASGAGAAAMEELRDSTAAAIEGRPYSPVVLPHPYAFNLFSHNAPVNTETGYNGEEEKVIAETRRILGRPRLPVGITCVRVPVLRAHSIAISFRLDNLVTPEQVRARVDGAPGLRLVDDRAGNRFPMPCEATGAEEVLVGRIRTDLGDPSGRTIAMFVSGDQLLKGAALNAVQIAEALRAPVVA